jgi:hypothetical protein
LNNLEFPLPKDDLYQVWLKLVRWFWRFFFNINTCKYGFPYCGPSQPLGTMMWTILNRHYTVFQLGFENGGEQEKGTFRILPFRIMPYFLYR